MTTFVLRALLILLAVQYAVTAPFQDGSCATGPNDGFGQEESSGRQYQSIIGEAAPACPTATQKSGRGPGTAGDRPISWQLPKGGAGERVALPAAAFAPGELPPSLTFLRFNGNVNANGVGA